MAIKLWSEMLDDVMPDLPQCPVDLVEHHLRLAAITFCDESGAYRFWAEALDIEAGSNEVDLDSPPQTEVCGVVTVVINGVTAVTPKNQKDLAAMYPGWQTESADTPRHYYQMEPDTLILYPIPTTAIAGALSVSVKVKPKDTAPGLESWVYRRYRKPICAKALFNLKLMDKKPWSAGSGKLQELDLEYRAGLGHAISQGSNSLTQATRRAVGQFM